MIKNYLKISFRNIMRHKGYSFLNIASLALGITCFLFISLFLLHELSYDKYHLKKDNIYRVVTPDYIGTPAPLLPACIKDIPEVVSGARVFWITKSSSEIFKYKEKVFNEKGYFLADPAFFEIFSFDFTKGDAKTALNDPKSIVITESIARKYFGNDDPVGKVMNLDNRNDLIVTGVVKDVPENSHFHFEIVGQFPQNIRSGWGGYNFLTYLLLADNANPDLVLKKIGDVLTKNTKYPKNPFLLQKLTDIHLNSHIRGELEQNGSLSNIYIYFAIAFIVLIIACINYTNLVTAQYSKRANEIGVRKVIGAEKKNIIAQFMTETMISISAAIICAIIMFVCLSPFVNNMLGKHLGLSQLGGWNVAIGLFSVALITAILSGGYPAFYLSSLNPVSVMKDSPVKLLNRTVLKKALLIVQLSFSLFFLITTLLISSQMNFLTKTKLGFNKEHILNIPMSGSYEQRNEAFAAELRKYPGIKETSFNNFLLSGNDYNQNVWWEGLREDDFDHGMRWIPVDNDFLKTFQLKLIQGNNFTENKTDTGYILNESALKYIGWKEAVGKRFNIVGKGTVVGVVEDYHSKSLRDSIVPCALVVLPKVNSPFKYLSLRLSSGDIPGTINIIKNVWQNIFPDKPFNYFFFDDDYNSLYKEEQKTGKIFNYAAILAICISFLGLFGLAVLTAQQKTKEIAVRKVLGASISNIVLLLSKDFAKLLLIANIISWPVAYYFIFKWLQDFAYKVDINYLAFAASAAGTFVLTLITISFLAVKTTLANPVNSLKCE